MRTGSMCIGRLKRAAVGAAMSLTAVALSTAVQAQSIDLSVGFQAFGRSSTSQLAPEGAPQGSGSLVPSVSFFSDDQKRAIDAYQRGDYATAKSIWEELAANGDMVAQWHLARMYRLGQGVGTDSAMSLQYYEQVSRHFDADRSVRDRFGITRDALFWVAHFYNTGVERAGIQPRPAYAFRLLRITANHGLAAGQYMVGTMLLGGIGTSANHKVGMRWLNLAAEKRYASAMAQLGDIYWRGELRPQDRARGLMWYILATENAREEINPDIYDRYEELYIDAGDEERRMAEGLALRWNSENPLRN